MPKTQKNFRFEESDLQQWKELANAENRSLTNWLEKVANEAVKKSKKQTRNTNGKHDNG